MTHSTSPSKHGATATATSSSRARLQHPHGVGERDRQRAAAELDVRDTVPASAAHTGATWLCSPQQTTGMPVERLGQRPAFLTVRNADLAGRVRQRHHVRALRPRRSPRPRVRLA